MLWHSDNYEHADYMVDVVARVLIEDRGHKAKLFTECQTTRL